MKIVYISERYSGSGAAEACRNLASEIARRGHEAHLLVAEPVPSELNRDFVVHQITDWMSYYSDWTYYSRSSDLSQADNYQKKLDENYLASFAAIKEYVNKESPDAIHLHNVSSMLRYEHIAELSNRYKVIWTAHARHPFDQFHNQYEVDGEMVTVYDKPGAYIADKFRFEEFLSASGAVTFVCPSGWLGEIAKNRLSGSLHKTFIVSNLIPEIEPNNEILGIKTQFNLDVLFLSAIKNTEYGLKNFEWAKAVFHKIETLLSGKGLNAGLFVTTLDQLNLESEGIYTISSANKAGLNFGNRFLNRSEMYRLYNEVDFTIISSLIENMPNTALESMVHGTPVISRAVGGMNDFTITDGVIVSNDAHEIAQKISKLLPQGNEYQSLCESARQTYKSKFDPDVVIKQHLDLYRGENLK